jgi:hypothetical protein
MRRLGFLAAAVLTLVAACAAGSRPALAADPGTAPADTLPGTAPVATAPVGDGATGSATADTIRIDATFDRLRISTTLGDRFTVRSRITNTGRSTAAGLIAHLNIVSLSSDVYVDPEDWSAGRTRELPSLEPGASTTPSWTIQAVNAGRFDVYVVLLPGGSASAVDRPAVTVPARVTVASRRTLNAGGTLPVVITIPVVLGFAAAATRLLLRRRRPTFTRQPAAEPTEGTPTTAEPRP